MRMSSYNPLDYDEKIMIVLMCGPDCLILGFGYCDVGIAAVFVGVAVASIETFVPDLLGTCAVGYVQRHVV